MNEILQVCNVTIAKRKNPNQGRVYHPSGIAPCVHTMGGGNLEPHIIEIWDANK